MNDIKVSIIVPVYNVEKYLRKCLESLCAQTLKDIEIICVDDGSTDNSGTILNEYKTRDRRIIVLSQENKGKSFAVNRAMKAAAGEYIGFVDADDWVSENFFKELFEKAKAECADIARSRFMYVYQDGEKEGDLNALITARADKNEILSINEHSVIVCDAIYRRKFIEKEKIIFDESLNMSEDVLFTAQATFLSSKTVPVKKGRYFYRKLLESRSSISHEKIKYFFLSSYKTLFFIKNVKAKLVDKKIAELRLLKRFGWSFDVFVKLKTFDYLSKIDYINKFLKFYLKISCVKECKKEFLKGWLYCAIKTFCSETADAQNLKEACRACSMYSFEKFLEKSFEIFPILQKIASKKDMEKIFKTQRREKFNLTYYIKFPCFVAQMYADLRFKKKIPSYFKSCFLFPVWLNAILNEKKEKVRKCDINVSENKKAAFLLKNAKQKKVLIKTPIPQKNGCQGWGEYWLARDIKEIWSPAFNAAVWDESKYPSWSNLDSYFDGAVYMRGRESFMPFDKERSVLWLFCHPEDVSLSEMRLYKAVACASENYAAILKEKGIRCEYVPQCTNPGRFFEDKDEGYETNVFFAGNTRGVFRNCVKFALEKNIDIRVFGRGWGNFIPERYIMADYVDNNMLRKYYSNAKITLNDHWDDMREQGFISNRIFDVTACGGFVISDYMPEIEKVYGDSVPMYKNAGELAELATYYLVHEDERRRKAEKAQKITLSLFTTFHTAEKLNALLFG